MSSFSIDAIRHDSNPRTLSKVHRALVKIALEFTWIDMGEEAALSTEHDRSRALVLSGQHHGYLAMPKKSQADDQIRVQYSPWKRVADEHPFLAILVSFWGVPIFTDTLHSEPVNDALEGFVVLTF